MVLPFIVKKKKKVPQYSIKLTPEVIKKLPDIAKKQIAELMARNYELQEELKKAKSEIEKLKGKLEPEEVKVVKKALKQKKVLEKLKEEKRVKLILEKPVKVLTYDKKHFRGKKGSYKYLYAIELQEYEVGYAVNLILKRDKKSKETGRITTDLSLDELFDKPYVVSELRSGTFIAPIYSDGTVVAKVDAGEGNPSNKETLSIDEEYYIKEISKRDEKIKRLKSEIYQLRKMKEMLTEEVDYLKNELELAKERAEWSKAISKSQLRDTADMMREYALMLKSLQQAEVNEHLAHEMSLMLSEAIRNLREDLRVKFGIPVDEIAFEKYFSQFKTLLGEVKEVAQPETHVVEKKEVKKK